MKHKYWSCFCYFVDDGGGGDDGRGTGAGGCGRYGGCSDDGGGGIPGPCLNQVTLLKQPCCFFLWVAKNSVQNKSTISLEDKTIK